MTGLHLISTQTDPSPVLFPYPPTQSKHCHLLWHKFERSLFLRGEKATPDSLPYFVYIELPYVQQTSGYSYVFKKKIFNVRYTAR